MTFFLIIDLSEIMQVSQLNNRLAKKTQPSGLLKPLARYCAAAGGKATSNEVVQDYAMSMFISFHFISYLFIFLRKPTHAIRNCETVIISNVSSYL